MSYTAHDRRQTGSAYLLDHHTSIPFIMSCISNANGKSRRFNESISSISTSRGLPEHNLLCRHPTGNNLQHRRLRKRRGRLVDETGAVGVLPLVEEQDIVPVDQIPDLGMHLFISASAVFLWREPRRKGSMGDDELALGKVSTELSGESDEPLFSRSVALVHGVQISVGDI